MSEKDRFEWNDDMEFDSDTDGQVEYDDFQDPLDGFADYDDMSEYEDLPEEDSLSADAPVGGDQDGSQAEATENQGQADNAPKGAKAGMVLKNQKKRRGISATGLGFLFTASILVAGIGIGGAVLLAEGVHPASLWQPQNLLQIDQLLNFADHPLNILYMVAMGVVFLALLGSYKMARVAIQANVRTRDAENMLDRVTALSLDQQEDWRSEDFKEYAPAEAFVMRTLGAWRLQEARQKRLMGVEGELHRLEKALTKNSRSDLTGRFDHPAVGRLADEMIRYFDARDVAVKNLEDYEGRDQSLGTEIVDALQEARRWYGVSLDSLNVQCASLDDFVREIENLAYHVDKAATEARSTEGMTDIIEAIRKDLAGSGKSGSVAAGMGGELNDLVDQGSKLAFQIAMEVARLGPRGERLLPMSQSLEDLTTGFRQLADRVNGQEESTAGAPGLESVHKKLETLAALITEDDQSAWGDVAEEIQDFGPAAARISENLIRMVDGFNQHEDRLVKLGTSFADLTGVEFDSSSIPRKESSEAPVASIDITRQERMIRPSVTEPDPDPAPVEVDPFASAGSSVLAGGDDQKDSTGESKDPGRFDLGSDSTADISLSGDDEKVYDLEDFEAPAATGPEAGAENPSAAGSGLDTEDPEPVFDLSSFGAAPVDDQEDPGQDEVFEVADLGGAPLESAADETGDEVYDLAEFGAMPAAGGADETVDEIHDLADFGAEPVAEPQDAVPEESAAGDEVFDLADFGAEPMK